MVQTKRSPAPVIRRGTREGRRGGGGRQPPPVPTEVRGDMEIRERKRRWREAAGNYQINLLTTDNPKQVAAQPGRAA